MAEASEVDRILAGERYAAPKRLQRFGWRAFSQNDEDGILQEIFRRIGAGGRRFVEIGVGDGRENNTAYLLACGWSGVWLEADDSSLTAIGVHCAVPLAEGRLRVGGGIVTRENVDDLLIAAGAHPEPDLLGVDIDGNDYHVLGAIRAVRPRVVVVEYNASYRPPVRWTIAYDAAHRWDGTNYFGASLSAFEDLMRARGYVLVGCNLNGVNAFFVRADLAGDAFEAPFTAEHHFEQPRFDLVAAFALRSGHPPRIGAAHAAQYDGDCGRRQFAPFDGRKLEDPRLDAVYALADAARGSHVLDIGCGRGELSSALAAAGAAVTAIDRSPDAIALARATACDAPVRFVCADATTFRDDTVYDVAIASDVIQHVAADQLDRIYANVSAMVGPGGSFVVHAWPNAWMQRYGQPRRRAAAAARGESWAEDPRTPYELSPHVNAPRPNVLRRQLAAAFEHVLVWVGTADDPRGSLGRSCSVAELRDASDVFAIASHAPIDRERVLRRITMLPAAAEAVVVALRAPVAPAYVRAGDTFVAEVTLRNDGAATLASFQPNPVRFAYRWSNESGPAGDDRGRSRLAPAAEPGSDRRYAVGVVAPEAPGTYTLRITLVQEFVRWFEASVELAVDVR